MPLPVTVTLAGLPTEAVPAEQTTVTWTGVVAGVAEGVSSSDTVRGPEKFRLPATNPNGLAVEVSGTTRVMRPVEVVIEIQQLSLIQLVVLAA